MKTNQSSGATTPRGAADKWSDLTHPFLAAFDPERVKQLLDHAQIVHFEPDEIIFREGAPANQFFLIESGSVAVESRTGPHSVIQISTVTAGEVLGWSWLYPPFAWHFQARAIEPTRAIACDGARLLVLCEEDPAFGYDLMKQITQVLIHRLQATRKQLIGIQGILNPLGPAPHAATSSSAF